MSFSIEKYLLPQKRLKMPSERERFIRLDLNESYGLINDDFLAKLKDFSAFTVGCYPEYEELLDLLADYTGVPAKNIFLSNGSDRAIELTFRLFFKAGDRVVMPSPTFVYYNILGNLNGLQLDEIPYKDTGSAFEFPYEEVKQALIGSKGLLLCNPSNPLGSVIDETQLEELIALAEEQGIPVMLDEAYFGFYPKTKAKDILKYKNLIVLRTFSKLFGMAGLRVGYMMADEAIIEEMLKMRPPWELNHFGVYAATVALKNLPYFEKQWTNFFARRDNMEKFFQAEGISVYKSDTNFFLFKTEKSANFLEAMRGHGILINDLSHHPSNLTYLANAMRMAIPSEQDIKKVQGAVHQTALQI